MKKRRHTVGTMPTRSSFSSDLDYLVHLEKVREYIDSQFRKYAGRFTDRYRRYKHTGAAK